MRENNKIFGYAMLYLGLAIISIAVISFISIKYGIMYAAILVGAILSIVGVIIIYFNRKKGEK